MKVTPLTPSHIAQDHLFPTLYPLMNSLLIVINKNWKNIDRGKVIPVMIALKEHSESGRLWETLINQILKIIGFTTTTHDRTIYTPVYKTTGENIYLLRQVDDFALACSNEYVAE